MPAREQSGFQIISTLMHGIADIVVAILLIAAPFLLGFANGGAAQWVPITLGVLMLGASVFTRYELGLIPVIPMPMHLMTDIAAGLFLMASPWIFGFADLVYLPQVLIGAIELGTAAMTKTQPRRVGMMTA
jgi:hypothetical protein